MIGLTLMLVVQLGGAAAAACDSGLCPAPRWADPLVPQLVTTAPPFAFDAATLRRLIGGFEVGLSYGQAAVSTGVVDETGQAYQVASGEAVRQGTSVALYSAPSSSGLFVSPQLGLANEAISIGDFRADLPGASAPASTEINGVCRDPDSLRPIDCDLPNVYQLRLTSAYAGLRAGASLVLRNRYLVLFAEAALSTRALEYRIVDAAVARQRSVRSGVELFASNGADVLLGVQVPRWHVAIKTGLGYDDYGNIQFGRPLGFMGRVIYDDVRRIYRRPIVRVDEARFGAWVLKATAAFTL